MPRAAQTDKKSKDHPKKVKAVVTETIRKPYRHKYGVKAAIEVRRLQKTTNTLLRKGPFRKLIKCCMNDAYEMQRSLFNDTDFGAFRLSLNAAQTAQQLTEALATKMLRRANALVILQKHRRMRASHIYTSAFTIFPKLHQQLEDLNQKDLIRIRQCEPIEAEVGNREDGPQMQKRKAKKLLKEKESDRQSKKGAKKANKEGKKEKKTKEK